jgi:preprotein translocase subunit SecF
LKQGYWYRWISKPELMKKKFIIILIIQVIIIGLLFIYGFMQKLEADKQRVGSIQVRIQAEQQLADMRKEINSLKVELENCR